MKEKFSWFSIKAKLILFSLCISLVPIASITTIYYRNVINELERNKFNELRAVGESKKLHVLTFMQAKRDRAVDLSSDGFIRDAVKKINEYESLPDVANALSRYLSETKKPLDPDIASIEIANTNGRIITSTNKILTGRDAWDLSNVEAFKQSIDKGYGKTFVDRPSYCALANANVLPIYSPIISMADKETIGFIIISFDISVFRNIIADRIGLGETGEVYLVDSDKVMITESRFTDNAALKLTVDTLPVRKILEESKEMVGIYEDYRGVSVVGVSAYIPEYDWIILAEIDKTEAFASLRILGIAALVVGCISGAFVITLGIVFSVSMARPISDLKYATNRFGQGDLEYTLNIQRRDELGDLANSFNEMIKKIASEITTRKQINVELHREIAERKRIEGERNQNIADLKRLIEFSDLVSNELQEAMLIKHMVHVIKEYFNSDILAVLMLDSKNGMIDVSLIDPPVAVDKLIKNEVILDPSLCRVIRTGQKFIARDAGKEPGCECILYNTKEYGHACLPLIVEGKVIGVVVIIKKDMGCWDDETYRLLTTYVGIVSSAIYRVRLIEVNKLASLTDALTGIYNRRFFNGMLEKHIALAKREKEPLSLLIADLDHFKKLNDAYGHVAGDIFLQQIAEIMKSSIRSSDILARYGGEEFVIIMPSTGLTGALEKADWICRHIESLDFNTVAAGQSLKMTLSIGAASFPEHGIEPVTLLSAADSALYKAKSGGRNRVEAP